MSGLVRQRARASLYFSSWIEGLIHTKQMRTFLLLERLIHRKQIYDLFESLATESIVQMQKFVNSRGGLCPLSPDKLRPMHEA